MNGISGIIFAAYMSIILHGGNWLLRSSCKSFQQAKIEVVKPGMQSPFKKNAINYTLFYITRNKNSNTVFYDANFKNIGEIDPENPIDVYFINYAEDGRRRDLNYIENALAYGVKIEKTRKNIYKLWLKAFPQRQLSLEFQNDIPVVKCSIAGRMAILSHIHVNARPPLYTHVNYVDVWGVVDGHYIFERVIND